jgi:putative FmdB family regulatory protein
MPIHDYECLTCHKRDDYVVKHDEKVVCKFCGNDQLQLRMSAPGHYKIKGNNSASTVPKKYRGER